MNKKVSKLRIALVTHAPFPVGNVSTMRYSSYLKAMCKAGVYSYVLIYCPTKMAAHIKKGQVYMIILSSSMQH